MTTLSRQYKLSKNILFYILQRHRSEQGKVVTIFRRGSESGDGVMLSNMTSKNKFIMLNIPLFLNCCQKTGRGGSSARLLRPCIGMSIRIIFLFVLYEPDCVLRLPSNFPLNIFKLPRFFRTTIHTTNSKIKITRVIGRAIVLKNKNEILTKNPRL